MRIQSKNGRLSSLLLGGLCLVVASAAGASHPDDGEAAMGACPQLAQGAVGIWPSMTMMSMETASLLSTNISTSSRRIIPPKK